MWDTPKELVYLSQAYVSEQSKEFIDKPTEEECTRMKEAGFMPY